MSVNTVTGPVEAEELGWTLPHEHLIVASDGTFLDSTLKFNWPEIEKACIDALVRAKEQGIRTIVDMTTIEMGRDASLLRRVSEASGVNIICCTGVFADEYGIPRHFRELTEEEIAELYVCELTKGIGENDVKAGVIKVATGGTTVTEMEEKFLRAAARAQQETGVPVLTHTGRGAGGERQIELLTAGGVPPHKIVIGHSDVSANIRYHLRLARSGVFVGFDRIGLEAFMPDVVRAGCIATMIRSGYLKQLTMSLDAHIRWCGRVNTLSHDREFTALQDEFFPYLTDAGVSDEQIHTITRDNIVRLFS